MKRKSVFLFTIIFIPYFGFSQSNYKHGYYITLNNDTVYGILEYFGDYISSKLCIFRDSISSIPKRLYPEDIAGYRFIGGKYYVSKEIKENNKQNIVFMEYLVNGTVDLYYLRSLEKDTYYFEKNNELYELEIEEINVFDEKKGQVKKIKYKYIGILNALLYDCPELIDQINHSKLNHNSLINITKNYHDLTCKDGECIIYQKNITKFTINIHTSIGLNYSQLNLNSKNYYNRVDFEIGYSPLFSLQLKSNMPYLSEKLLLLTGIDFNKNQYWGLLDESNQYREKYTNIFINTTTIHPLIGFSYDFGKKKINPDFSIGSILYFNLKNDTEIIEEIIYNSILTKDISYESISADYLTGFFSKLGTNIRINRRLFIDSGIRYSRFFSRRNTIQELYFYAGLCF
jgi:hypothetical protein